jgi:putative transposase
MPRVAPGGEVFHVLNRANNKHRLFRTEHDYLAFYEIMRAAMAKCPIRLLAWCVMGNHWHFVAWPREDGDLSRFFGYLSLMHAVRWQTAHNAIGLGHVYQSRFKNFMIERDEHLLWVLRYVERNPLRANLVKRAQDWRWSSLHARLSGDERLTSLLTEWPIERPADWTRYVNRPQTPAEEEAIAVAIKRGRPLGDDQWIGSRLRQYSDLRISTRPQGRPPGWRKKK